VGQLQDEIKEMTKFSTIAITAADGIGTAFGNSFKSLIDGSMSAREALSSFFKDVASMFLEMAAQIIAKQMTMIILQTILKALGAVSGASGGGSGGDLAKVNMVDVNKYSTVPAMPFANGGVFGSPTFFKFAEGGTMQNGVLGEAGPEAIMPLSRGAGGKLGVNASGLREAMGGAPGMGGSPVLSMSFETTRFGDTDYVSRDQLEAAMAQTRKQASADGAKRGMSMTLDRLQQSPQTRSRVGLR
jgi:phage-related minor tail protein